MMLHCRRSRSVAGSPLQFCHDARSFAVPYHTHGCFLLPPLSFAHRSCEVSFATLPTSATVSNMHAVCFSKLQKRHKGDASSARASNAPPSPYSDSLNLPKTDFALRSDAKKLEEAYKDAAAALYKWQVRFIDHSLTNSALILI